MVEIRGEIIEIIYKNETNGYTICNILTKDDEEITVVGFLPYIQVGEEIKVNGNWVNFEVAAFDEKGEIGKGTHTRYIVDAEKFMAKLQK